MKPYIKYIPAVRHTINFKIGFPIKFNKIVFYHRIALLNNNLNRSNVTKIKLVIDEDNKLML